MHSDLKLEFSPSGRFASQGYYFYRLLPTIDEKGLLPCLWQRIEYYLPPSTGVFNEPLWDTRDRYFKKLESGEVNIRRSIESGGKKFRIVEDSFKLAV